jgi:uncharacterized protein YndB with AHSA1/START domain
MADETTGREFEVREEIELPASPEDVWAAIATGPGIDSWFVGHMEVEPREGGQASLAAMPGVTQQFTVTAWEPGRRFGFRGDPGPDGAFMAFEYLVEGRGQATTVLRFVHSGFLAGDWDSEYDALSGGDRMYLAKLGSYLRYFPGQTAAFHVMCWGPQVADAERVWSAFAEAAGLAGAGTGGTAAREGGHGLVSIGRAAPAQAIVDYVAPSFLGVRTSDSLYRFIHGHQGAVVVEQHAFAGDGQAREHARDAWQDWLGKQFA